MFQSLAMYQPRPAGRQPLYPPHAAMNPSAPPTADDALHALLPHRGLGSGPAAAWPAPHRMLATVAGMLLCVLAGTGCADTRSSVAQRAVAPTYSYVHDASPENRQALWPLAPLHGGGTLIADSGPTP